MTKTYTFLLIVLALNSCNSNPISNTIPDSGKASILPSSLIRNDLDFDNFLKRKPQDSTLNTSSFIMDVLLDKKGNFWFATHSLGFGIFNGNYQYIFENKAGIEGNVVRQIIEDENGILWFATNGGLYKYDAKNEAGNPESYQSITVKDGLPTNQIWSLCSDKTGGLWIGTETGLCHYNGKEYTSIKLPVTGEVDLTGAYPAPDMITSIYQASDGLVWIGTNGKGIFVYNPTLGNAPTAFKRHTSESGLCNSFIQCIKSDSKGNIWIGTRFGGVSKFSNGKFNTMNKSQGLQSLFVRDIHEDKFGQIWIATAGGGVFCTDGKSNYTFTKADGLSDDFIQSIQEDKDGNIWLGTGLGITRFSGNKPLQQKNLKSGKIKDEHKAQMFTFENPMDGC